MATWRDVAATLRLAGTVTGERDDGLDLMLSWPNGRRQPVFAFPLDRANEPTVLMIVSPVCRFSPDWAGRVLDEARACPFGLKVISSDVVVVYSSYLGVIDTSAIAQLANEVGWFADQLEAAITGTDSDAEPATACESCGADRLEGARFCGSCGTPYGDAVAPSPNPASGPSGIPVITSGTWIVGAEIAPGMYRVAGYWARLDSHQGIIANDNVHGSGLSLLKVVPSDSYIEISGEAASLSDMPSVDPIASDMRSGTYLVGVDIAPGRYRVSGEGSLAYAERIDRNMNTIQNEANYGSVLIQIAPSDFAFKFSGLLLSI